MSSASTHQHNVSIYSYYIDICFKLSIRARFLPSTPRIGPEATPASVSCSCTPRKGRVRMPASHSPSSGLGHERHRRALARSCHGVEGAVAQRMPDEIGVAVVEHEHKVVGVARRAELHRATVQLADAHGTQLGQGSAQDRLGLVPERVVHDLVHVHDVHGIGARNALHEHAQHGRVAPDLPAADPADEQAETSGNARKSTANRAWFACKRPFATRSMAWLKGNSPLSDTVFPRHACSRTPDIMREVLRAAT